MSGWRQRSILNRNWERIQNILVPMEETPNSTENGLTTRKVDSNVFPGFNRDGDTIELPTSNNGTLTYRNSSGTTVTSLNVTSVTDGSTNAANWVGFAMRDDYSAVDYVASDGSNNCYVGRFTSAGNSFTAKNVSASIFSYTPGTGGLTYDSDGNLLVFTTIGVTAAGDHETKINRSTGAIIAANTRMFGNNSITPSYKTVDGIYTGRKSFPVASDYRAFLSIASKNGYYRNSVPIENVMVSNNVGSQFIRSWGEGVVNHIFNSSTHGFGYVEWATKESFDEMIREIATLGGWKP